MSGKGKIYCLIMVMIFACGCGKTKKIEETGEKAEVKEIVKNEDIPSGEDALVDISSGEEVMEFLSGDWRIYDTIGKVEYGTLTIRDDGDMSFLRDDVKKPLKGSFSPVRHQTYDAKADELKDDKEYTGFELYFKDIPDDYDPGMDFDNWENPKEEYSTGKFYIAAGKKYDYLYLEWLGNGDSYTFTHIFQDQERMKKEYEGRGDCDQEYKWVLRRKSEGIKKLKPEKDAEFYAFAWGGGDGKIALSKMEPHTYETQDEYTARRFNGAYFSETQNIGITEYEILSDADTSMVFSEEGLISERPLKMYKISTDDAGKIKVISDVEEAYYGEYDFGNLDQEFEYDGLKFKINGWEYDLEERGTAANAITDMKQVGDWIVVDAHVGPHAGIYYLYNIYSGEIEGEIEGANLTWVGDDITTAVYSAYDEVFDFKQNVIGFTEDGDEVYDLTLSADGSEVTAEDMNGHEYTFEVENGDKAMYRYADFLRNYSSKSWKDFISEAPEDAIAYVMLTPPEIVKKVLPLSANPEDEENCIECIYAISLKNDTSMHLDTGEYDPDNDEFKTDTTLVHNKNMVKGEAIGYNMVISEALPTACLYVASGKDGGRFPVVSLSGKTDICGMFITASMSYDEAEETAVDWMESEDGGEDDMLDSYMDILSMYHQAWEEKMDADQISKLGLFTGLTERGWPQGSDADAVRYHFIDIDGNGTDELVITYLGYIVDIYAGNSWEVKLAYSGLYRSEATLREDGTIECLFSGTASDGRVTWYRFDGDLADFMPEYYYTYNMDKDGKVTEEYFITSYADGGRDDVVDFYKEMGNIPVWAYENSRQIDKKEYGANCSKAEVLELDEGERIADFTGKW